VAFWRGKVIITRKDTGGADIVGTPEEAMRLSREMREITIATHPTYRIPAFGFDGVPVGIDILKVVRTGVTPIIDTAIAHRDAGHAMIGAGLVRAPMECFEKALEAFSHRYGFGQGA